jgi:hypothetical protein
MRIKYIYEGTGQEIPKLYKMKRCYTLTLTARLA